MHSAAPGGPHTPIRYDGKSMPRTSVFLRNSAWLPSVVCGAAEHCLLLRPVHSLAALPTAARRCTWTARSSRAGRGARPATPRPPHMLCTSCHACRCAAQVEVRMYRACARPVHSLGALPTAARRCTSTARSSRAGRGARPATPRPPHMLCTSCRPVPVHRLATLAIAFRNAEQRSPYGSMGRGVGLESQICQRLLRLRWGRPSSLHTPLHCIPRARPSLQVR